MDPIRVLIADDDPAILEILTFLVSSDPSMDFVGAASGADEAIDLAKEHLPDVALLDARMPGGGGPRAARGIRRGSPHTDIIALSVSEDPVTVVTMLDSGASGYVSKGDSTKEILRAIHRSREGRTSLSARVRGAVAETLADHVTSQARAAGRRSGTRSRIKDLIDSDAIHIVFQPIVNLRTGDVVAVEALARFMTRPRRSPEVWFADARDTGVGVELELAAARRALTNVEKLSPPARLAVNLSPEAICSEQLAVALSQVPLDRLIVEVTEQTRIVDEERFHAVIEGWRAEGLLLAVDDVGAGFSGLNRVVDLRPDFIKLDLALTHGIASDHVRRTLVSTLATFAVGVGTAVIAEGIESDDQITGLLELGVELGQGYRLGRPGPLPPADATDRVRWAGRHAFRG
ncbi:MAG TPA: EAL domain-containing protein [Actinomycetota bacterium]|jgi:EAL domain-containing protein (putative c-di-GMP-specific phosphodiesterase class I)|nr:EAL domain-containing protein [Actinomycetota bacterium]